MDENTRIFEEHRRQLEGVAYRMLGTLDEARDMVQETYMRWREAGSEAVRNPRAWLVTVCSRLCLDVMKSARARRETYVGTWLPEPHLEATVNDPASQMEIDDTVSMALMLALEKLSPAERAAFLLHEVFACSFEEIAQILGKSEAGCRKLASRARASVRASKPKFEASSREHERLVTAFLDAARAGDLNQLKAVLAESVEVYSDGGGKAEAVPRVLVGVETVAAFFMAVWKKLRAGGQITLVERRFNGAPGVLIYERGRLTTALTVSVKDGMIQRIYGLRNPDKLAPFEAVEAPKP